ncbi:MAG: carbamoyltransferase HypF [Atopobiaceae bacterium]|nr:carbamoyltransferase HypF [Atopobiaceae bacterium]
MITRRIRAYGIVQGVGFRPTVDRHATSAGIAGTVCNKGPYVEIYAQGSEGRVARFIELLRSEPPRRAVVLKLDVKPVRDAKHYDSFSIVSSEKTEGQIFVSPDIAICEDCKRELFDKGNRRYLHPFINCTCCGPRLTILEALPYDRERTSMREFPMCEACANEYHDPASRRYDAQPVCCNDCGPQAYLVDGPERGRAAITEARRIIADGGVVAVKGIGGFHLCCDATNPDAVGLLRERKRRSAKPFAVMARDLAVARRECVVSPVAQEILTGHQKPILLLPRRSDGQACEACAPHNPKLGIMLPYAPLQLLLFEYDDGLTMPDVLVMTSANESGAPICRDDEDARRELGKLCDAILSHERKIRVRADDTVMDLFEDKPYMIRRSRGWAPLPFLLSEDFGAHVLATGGELKNTFCLGSHDMFYPSPYVGDLEDVRTVHALQDTIVRFQTLLEFEPEMVACDLHPKYNATLVAHEFSQREGLPLVEVQHHYAHVAACMAENDVAAGAKVIGVSFDGTGYGEDGTVWGGEVLICDYEGYERAWHIAPFVQAGGDLAAKEGWRVAVAMLGEGDDALDVAERLGLATKAEARIVQAMVKRRMNAVLSTSAGRLFDAVSAVLGIRRASTFEGEAATQLQFAAERGRELGGVLPKIPHFSQTDELFAWIVERCLAQDPADWLAYAFHVGLSQIVEDVCAAAREKTSLKVVALTGGCYQNLLLLELTVSRLRKKGFCVLTHSLVPPNDGGIALGQAVVAAARYRKTQSQGDALASNKERS